MLNIITPVFENVKLCKLKRTHQLDLKMHEPTLDQMEIAVTEDKPLI